MDPSPAVITRSASGHRFLNPRFACTLVGALEIGVLIMGLLGLVLLGSAMSHDAYRQGNQLSGFTFYVFLFMVAFWCFMTSSLIFITSLTSCNTTGILFKTTFFSVYHAVAGFFYVISSCCLLAQAVYYSYIKKPDGKDVKGLVITSGALGLITSVLYIILTVLGVVKYRTT